MSTSDHESPVTCTVTMKRAQWGPPRVWLTRGAASPLSNLGEAYARLGVLDQALALKQESFERSRELDDLDNVASTLVRVAETYRLLDRTDQAVDCCLEAIALSRENTDLYWEARALWQLGSTYRDCAPADQAQASWRHALAIFERLDAEEAHDVRALLSR